MEAEVRREPENSRYALVRDGETIGFADYEVQGNVILFTHTEVDPEYQGQGLAAQLVHEALEDVRTTTDLRLIPLCSYVSAWLGRHPEYQDLRSR
ncbi:MAG: GNAT family N-acetyltransferase [Microbacteriaceae bacterium]